MTTLTITNDISINTIDSSDAILLVLDTITDSTQLWDAFQFSLTMKNLQTIDFQFCTMTKDVFSGVWGATYPNQVYLRTITASAKPIDVNFIWPDSSLLYQSSYTLLTLNQSSLSYTPVQDTGDASNITTLYLYTGNNFRSLMELVNKSPISLLYVTFSDDKVDDYVYVLCDYFKSTLEYLYVEKPNDLRILMQYDIILPKLLYLHTQETPTRLEFNNLNLWMEKKSRSINTSFNSLYVGPLGVKQTIIEEASILLANTTPKTLRYDFMIEDAANPDNGLGLLLEPSFIPLSWELEPGSVLGNILKTSGTVSYYVNTDGSQDVYITPIRTTEQTAIWYRMDPNDLSCIKPPFTKDAPPIFVQQGNKWLLSEPSSDGSETAPLTSTSKPGLATRFNLRKRALIEVSNKVYILEAEEDVSTTNGYGQYSFKNRETGLYLSTDNVNDTEFPTERYIASITAGNVKEKVLKVSKPKTRQVRKSKGVSSLTVVNRVFL